MTNLDKTVTPPNRTSALLKHTVPGRTVALYCLAIVSAATAVIHFAVAGEHFEEYWAFGGVHVSGRMAATALGDPGRRQAVASLVVGRLRPQCWCDRRLHHHPNGR